MADLSDDELLAELGVAIEQPKARTYTPREERIIAGFEDIVRFHEEHGRPPQHGEDRDIFERLYAVRLDRLRELDECRDLLTPLDTLGLLNTAQTVAPVSVEDIDDDALLAELGISVEPDDDDIRVLRHVPSADERRAAEEIANREKCQDFSRFKPLFEQVERDLETGVRTTRPFVKDAGFLKSDITKGQFFILGGQIAYVADFGESFRAPNGETDARLRVVYSNATESNLLLRSLQRALYKDEAGRRITESEAGPLFAAAAEDGDLESGTIYVLRSKSDHPTIAAHRDLIHKIGVTGGSVEARISNAARDATYLFADVEVIATYSLYNINRAKLEALIHRVFATAQVDLTIQLGSPVKPREWFLAPLAVIDEAVARIRDGTITNYVYDPKQAALVVC
ncbi:GIY-YIG nuclease family protein [Rhizorhabdus histidinilytica]|uniref:T5orf172 domain-containing protein n=1 Tax=Rhizorhabdus histidinilytica TaxID=439228 RepID=A0A1T5H1P3_9SPHN|nr:GIY-YIG nuclease family protein [Rhizorhabdus histidinilytica]SKC14568.1 T5orf172 domain-containing protein [Rhizorhabdus histidinilytica]